MKNSARRLRLLYILTASIITLLAIFYVTSNVYVGASGQVITGKVSSQTLDTGSQEKIAISFQLAYRAKVRIAIQDSSGAIVRYPYQPTNFLNKGTYNNVYQWDGTDRFNNRLPSDRYKIVFEISKNTLFTNGDIEIVTVLNTEICEASGGFSVQVTANPAAFDPTTQQTSINYNITNGGSYKLFVKNASNTEVKTFQNFTDLNTGNISKTWDGKNNSNTTLAPGTYVAVAEIEKTDGSIEIAGSTPIELVASSKPLPTDQELGQTIEGYGSANFTWLKSAGMKYGISFTAERSGSINRIMIPWKSKYDYGYDKSEETVAQAKARHGKYTFEIQSNSTTNFPSGTRIGRAATDVFPEDGLAKALGKSPAATDPCIGDGAMQVDFPEPIELRAGEKYHLVISNTASNPGQNWSSPNTMMTRIVDWPGGGNRAEFYDGSKWQPWTSINNPFGGTNALNGSHAPVFLGWTDGVNTGDPYYSSTTLNATRRADFIGTNWAGEKIVWNKEATAIKKIGISLQKNGTPKELKYHIDRLDNGKYVEMATGVMANASDVNAKPTWVYKEITPITFENGKTYRLWFDSPTSTSGNNFFQPIVYGDLNPSIWIANTWGGTSSVYVKNGKEDPAGDLTFSLQN